MTVSELREAVYNKGPRPDVHDAILARHRREAPKVWAAIDKLIAEHRPVWSNALVNLDVDPYAVCVSCRQMWPCDTTKNVRREARGDSGNE